MDRYLYKAKRIDTGEWVEGYYALRPDNEAVIMRKCDEAPDADPMWKKVLVTYQIDPSTLCRCTGLKDKNGKLIWENDIVEAWSEGICAKGTVKCRIDGLWLMYPAWQKGLSWGLCPNDTGSTTVTVLGNIFDNPELLEV